MCWNADTCVVRAPGVPGTRVMAPPRDVFSTPLMGPVMAVPAEARPVAEESAMPPPRGAAGKKGKQRKQRNQRKKGKQRKQGKQGRQRRGIGTASKATAVQVIPIQAIPVLQPSRPSHAAKGGHMNRPTLKKSGNNNYML